MPFRDLALRPGVPGPRRCRRRHPESDWDQGNWPLSDINGRLTDRKTILRKRFLLKPEDMVDLLYEAEPYVYTRRGVFPAKRYSVQECERRAWEIYGGPGGFEAEKAVRAARGVRRAAQEAARGLSPPPHPPGPRVRRVYRRPVAVGRGRNRAHIPGGVRVFRAHIPEVVNMAPAQLPIPLPAPAVRVESPEPQLYNGANYDSDSDVVIVERFPTPPRTPTASPRTNRANRTLTIDKDKPKQSKSQPADPKVPPSTPKARRGVLDLTSSSKQGRVQASVQPPSIDNHVSIDLTSMRLSNPSTPSRKRKPLDQNSGTASGSRSRSFLTVSDSQSDSDSDDGPPPSPFSSLLSTPSSSQRRKTIATLVLEDSNDEDVPQGRSPRANSSNVARQTSPTTPNARSTARKQVEIIDISD